MQLFLRISLWMCLLIGYLHARPVINKVDVGFKLLRKEVLCGQNVNFTSPTNVQTRCYGAAMESFMTGLAEASENCDDNNNRTASALWALELGSDGLELASSTECQWERKQLADFLKDLSTFIQQLNNEA